LEFEGLQATAHVKSLKLEQAKMLAVHFFGAPNWESRPKGEGSGQSAIFVFLPKSGIQQDVTFMDIDLYDSLL
jgi:hypothetical protein